MIHAHVILKQWYTWRGKYFTEIYFKGKNQTT
jgi:hypothetical protein